MKPFLFLVFIFSVFTSCFHSKKRIEERLPKDISEMPMVSTEDRLEAQRKRDEQAIQKVMTDIQGIIDAVPCTNAELWRISPLGSKSCGGPAAFIAYPVEKEDDVLPKISEFNRKSSAYNLKYGIISDCVVEPSPSSISCKDGKPVLVFD